MDAYPSLGDWPPSVEGQALGRMDSAQSRGGLLEVAHSTT